MIEIQASEPSYCRVLSRHLPRRFKAASLATGLCIISSADAEPSNAATRSQPAAVPVCAKETATSNETLVQYHVWRLVGRGSACLQHRVLLFSLYNPMCVGTEWWLGRGPRALIWEWFFEPITQLGVVKGIVKLGTLYTKVRVVSENRLAIFHEACEKSVTKVILSTLCKFLSATNHFPPMQTE